MQCRLSDLHQIDIGDVFSFSVSVDVGDLIVHVISSLANIKININVSKKYIIILFLYLCFII